MKHGDILSVWDLCLAHTSFNEPSPLTNEANKGLQGQVLSSISHTLSLLL